MLRFVPRGKKFVFELFDEDYKNTPPPPPPKKKLCTVTVCVSKVYDLNSDLFTILAFKGS